MGKIQHFEDLVIWQKAMDISVKVYKLSGDERLKKEWGIRDQIIRSSLSISSNIAEGFEYNSDAVFARYLKIAKSSAGELRSQLYFLQETKLIDDETYNSIYTSLVETSAQIKKLINYLKKS